MENTGINLNSPAEKDENQEVVLFRKKIQEIRDLFKEIIEFKTLSSRPGAYDSWFSNEYIKKIIGEKFWKQGKSGELSIWEIKDSISKQYKKRISNCFEEIIKISVDILDKQAINSTEVVELYQELSGYPDGFYAKSYEEKRDDYPEDYIAKIVELEYELDKRIKLQAMSNEDTNEIISKSTEIFKGNNYFATHVTDAEMLPWLWNTPVDSQSQDSFFLLTGKKFGNADSAYGHFNNSALKYDTARLMIEQNKEIDITIRHLLKNMGRRTISGMYNQEILYTIESQKEDMKKLINLLKNINWDVGIFFDKFYIDYKEWLKLKENGFFEKKDSVELTDDEKDIIANMLTRFNDMIKAGLGSSSMDIALWIDTSGSNITRKQASYDDKDVVGLEYDVPGMQVIKAIQCATPYAFKKVTNILKLQNGNDFKKYPPIFDRYGNMLWPKRMSLEEVRNFVIKKEEKKVEQAE